MSRSEAVNFDGLMLAESRERISLQGRDQFRQASEAMVRQAKRTLDIFTYDLDKPVFDQGDFLEAVKQLALTCRGMGIRILLQDSERARREGHRLVDLSRRITSKIEIRRPHEDYIDHPENFIIVDRIGYIRRRNTGLYEGEANFCHPMEARLLTDFFSEVWERSEQESSLRRLHL
ncbi:hypothetical protein [Sedimenticola thiotaurini]|uniref:DUF7931 domain-containing protein n=1 Tax=Sedimenticola thiotaurini TaxID=1543721 RepID=A0A0F7JW54_9GAMM|nr:hypothetical protein [Sedimenticola thiotaurini]AKH19867.1 hypothetical protein AAY24_05325 [Sedimenticola thiotaurini]